MGQTASTKADSNFCSPHVSSPDRLLYSKREAFPFSSSPQCPRFLIHFLLSGVSSYDGEIDVPRTTSIRNRNQGKNDGRDDTDKSTMTTTTTTTTHSVFYRIYTPLFSSFDRRTVAPLLVIHGGPSVPSDYLFPLVDYVRDRPIVFYDQLGCGRSDSPHAHEPDNADIYSIEKSVDDLELLIKKLGLRRFHLYGQSFGGVLAYEYLKRVAERRAGKSAAAAKSECLSVVLSSTPTSISLAEEEVTRLLRVIVDGGAIREESEITNLFRKRHQCRSAVATFGGVARFPKPLRNAYAHAGTGRWRDTAAVREYAATAPDPKAETMPPAMIIRGEYDFVTNACVKGWSKSGLFNHDLVREKLFDDCSHFVLLENGKSYGESISAFCAEYDLNPNSQQ